MLIINKRKTVQHKNPNLIKGHTYQLLNTIGTMAEYAAGNVFVVGSKQIVWLATKDRAEGGHDDIVTLALRRAEYVEVDLTLA